MNIFCTYKRYFAPAIGLLFALLLSLPAGPVAHGKSTSFNGPADSGTPGWLSSDFLKVFTVKEPIHLVLVEKSTQRLLVLRHDGRLRQVAQYTCATGENPGQKWQSGDSRTPEGVYFITKIFTDKKNTVFGNRAFHLDYPNIYDKAAGRNGDGIYIHGTNKKLTPNSTNGCITLKNKDLDDLVQYLDTLVTPVIVVQDLNFLRQMETNPVYTMPEMQRSLIPEQNHRQDTRFNYLYLLNYGDQAISVGEYTRYLDESTRIQGYSRSYLDPAPDSRLKVWERISKNLPMQIYPGAPIKIASYILPPSAGKIISETQYTVPPEIRAEAAAGEPVQVARLETEAQPGGITPRTSQINISSITPVPAKSRQTADQGRKRNAEKAEPTKATAGEPEPAAPLAPPGPKPEPVRAAEVKKPPKLEKKTEPVKVAALKTKPAAVQVPPEPVKDAEVKEPPKPEKKAEPVKVAALETKPAAVLLPPEPEPVKTVAVNRQQATEKAAPAKDPRSRRAILDFLKKWRGFWEAKKIGQYIASYDESFRQGGMDLAAWRKHKDRLNKKYEYIKVDISNIKINWTGSGATVTFWQEYRSDKYKATGTKTLHLKTQDKDWKIARETWSKAR